jgi:hypothetical protein
LLSSIGFAFLIAGGAWPSDTAKELIKALNEIEK